MSYRLLASAGAVLTGLCGIGLVFGAAPLSLKIAAATIAGLAATRTSDALVIVVALAPLGGVLAALSGSPRSWTISLVLAFLFGAAVRSTVKKPIVGDRPAFWTATVWIGLVVASVLTQLWTELHASPESGRVVREFADWLIHQFPMTSARKYGAVEPAVLAATGVALFALTATLGRRDDHLVPTVARAILVSVAAVGVLSVNRLIEVALRRPPFLTSLAEVHRTLRISAVFSDVNAAGALFLITAVVAYSFLWQRAGRAIAIASIPWLLAGLWLSGSRSGLAVLPVALTLVTLLVSRRDPQRRAARLSTALVVASVLILTVFTAIYYPRIRAHSLASRAVAIRMDLITTTMSMTRTSPWFGVGIGRYYQRSSEFMPEPLRRLYKSQNAHNQLLQVLGELGITGLCAFLAVLAVGVGPAWRSLRRGARDPVLVGLFGGVVSFLVVSLGMHPLLIPEVAATFYVVLGLARARATSLERLSPARLNQETKEDATRLYPAT
jgi:O-antigen ligase